MKKPISPGLIYFIADHGGGAVKIGYSTNPRARLASLQTAHHARLSLIHLELGTEERERELHRMFDRLHMRGEWFRRDDALYDYINAVDEKLGTVELGAYGYVWLEDDDGFQGLAYYDDDDAELDEACQHDEGHIGDEPCPCWMDSAIVYPFDATEPWYRRPYRAVDYWNIRPLLPSEREAIGDLSP